MIARKLLATESKNFWKGIKKVNSSSNIAATTLDGVTGNSNICDKWNEYFGSLLNSCIDRSDKETVCNSFCDLSKETDCVIFSPIDIYNAIKKTKSGKSGGSDKVMAEHLKFAHAKINVLLSMIFNAMLCHGHLPDGLMQTLIVPLIKDKKESVTVSTNYRPIAITNIISIVLKNLIMKACVNCLNTTDNQFGFKSNSSTDVCVFTFPRR